MSKRILLIGLMFLAQAVSAQLMNLECGIPYQNYNFDTPSQIQNTESRIYQFLPSQDTQTVRLSFFSHFADKLSIKLNGQLRDFKTIGAGCNTFPGVDCIRGPAKWTITESLAQFEPIFDIPDEFQIEGLSGFDRAGVLLIEVIMEPSTECRSIEFIFERGFEFPALRNYQLACPENANCPLTLNILQEEISCGTRLNLCGSPNTVTWTDPNGNTFSDFRFVAQENGSYQVSARYPGCTNQLDQSFEIENPEGTQRPSVTLENKRFLCLGGHASLNAWDTPGLDYGLGNEARIFRWYKNGQELPQEPNEYEWVRNISFSEPQDFGVYTVKVQDVNSCRAQSSIDLQPSPEPKIGRTGSFCSDGISYLEPSPPKDKLEALYPWSNPSIQWTLPGGATTTRETLLATDVDPHGHFDPPGVYKLKVEFESTGCTATDELDLEFSPLEIESQEVQAAKCEDGGSVTLNIVNPMGDVEYSWQIWQSGEWQISDSSTFTGLAPDETYTLCATDEFGCRRCSSITIPQDLHTFEISLPQECSNAPIVLNLRDSHGEYVIEPIEENVDTSDLGNFKRFSVSYENCVFEKEVELPEKLSAPIYVPNAFSPNGDGKNDVFKVYNDQRSDLKIYLFSIVNPWGQVIYKEVDKTIETLIGWDGTERNRSLPKGKYLYHIVYGIEGCDQKESRGIIHLIR
ncbi:MAG: gliding motility-associated C-terminal domain-containing protein [Bdellovibrionales bacterium]|nr:gliding motility-associated C-terminal domain-containing protein [Bdellovibrionales bacterium]